MDRDAMINRTEAEWDALQDALGTQPGWRVGRVLSEQDIADLALIDKCHREDEEGATDAYHRGYEEGLRERGGDALVEASRRVSEANVRAATERAMRALANARADKVTELLREAGTYVADALDAHEHSDGRDLLNRINAAIGSVPGFETAGSAADRALNTIAQAGGGK